MKLAAVAVTLGVLSVLPQARAPEPVTVEGGLRFPAGIAFDSQGTMYVTEREGRILAFNANGAGPRTVASIPTITQGEAGLLGITVSPDERSVYAFATFHDGRNRIWRVPVRGGRPEVVVEGLPGGTYHHGGGVAFGDDGMLYVSNGEGHDQSLAQDPGSLGGKIYRFTPDGGIPSDNPFGDSPAFSIGHRNPFGLAIDPVSGTPFVTENGPDSHDEVNRIVAGGNYGWPEINGSAGDADTSSLEGSYQDPLLDYVEIIVPTGIAFADPRTAARSVSGDLFFATFGDQTIHRVGLNDARDRATEDAVFFRSPEPIVALAWGPRGLYFSTPGAVKVFPLTRPPRGSPASPDEAQTAPAPEPLDGDEGSSFPTGAVLLVGGAAAVLIGALAYAFRPWRR